jgi:murein DD-endopeptidase MepM/ murein hydrolase activator NlpD
MRLALVIAAALVFSGCATSLKRAKFQALPGATHIVKKGDSLWDIAQRNQVSLDDLMEVNGIRDASSLRVGQILFIPDSDSPSPSGSPREPRRVATPSKAPVPDDDGRTIALDWPVKNGVMFRSFDKNPARLYEGIALGAPPSTQVAAAASGEVLYVGDDGTHFGRVVIVKHDEPFVTIYAHLDQISVVKGQQVKKGDILGTVGTSGGAESPRVYFQVRKNRMPVDPELYLTKAG